MNIGKDYIPHADGEFLEWVKFLFTYLLAHASEFGIDPTTMAEIESLITAYDEAYAKAKAPNRGKADVKAKNEARDALKKAVRLYVKEFVINNHLISDEQLEQMALPVHDTKPTPAPRPTDMPVGEVDFSTRQRHTVHVKAGTLTGRAKPPKVHGYEVWRKIGGDPPASDDDWTYVNFSSRSPLVIDYPLTDVGKTVYYRFRWVNTRNQPGPWSEGFVSAIIP
jgi:hypothetical protein